MLVFIKNTIRKNSKQFHISRSEQAPGSGFHHCDISEKSDCSFLGPPCCNRKIDPERYVSFGSYELFVSNVTHQIYEKKSIQN